MEHIYHTEQQRTRRHQSLVWFRTNIAFILDLRAETRVPGHHIEIKSYIIIYIIISLLPVSGQSQEVPCGLTFDIRTGPGV